MKATKLLGSVALTAALAMGTMPAFASATAPSDWENGVDKGVGGAGVSTTNKMANVTTDANNANIKMGTGSTAVKASVFDADLQVTIPLQLSVAFASVGSTLTCPTDGTYQITNNGDKDVKISRVQATSSQFKIDTLANVSGTTGQASTYYGTNGKHGIAMVLDFGDGVKVDLGKLSAYSYTGTDSTREGQGWLSGGSGDKVKEVTIGPKSPKGINLSGQTTNMSSAPMSVGYQLATILEISYTIETATTTSGS